MARINKTITIAASFAQKPLQGGHAWVLLQYLLGFRRLGWDVLFLDALEPEMCFDASGKLSSLEQSLNLQTLNEVMSRFGLQDSYSLLFDSGRKFVGLPREQVLKHVRKSEFLLNIMGFLTHDEILDAASRLVFLDIDPGFGQMWQDLGLVDLFSSYDDLVTIGENIGRNDCGIPTCSLPWITTVQPIVLDYWPPAFGNAKQKMSSIASWRGAYSPVDYHGKVYGLRAHEFRKFSSLPHKVPQEFQLALNIHPGDKKDLDLLLEGGWQIVDPISVAGDPWAYRSFIQSSSAEFMVAKNIYVDTQSGWFSDRSICYLSSGKPVLAQDTGLKDLYPVGEGLLLFGSLEEAVAGCEALYCDYNRHAQAARALAESYFDSDKVLGNLLAKLGVQ